MKKNFVAASIAALTLMTTGVTGAFAQNVFQKHPTATGVAAGVATHHMLKKSAASKKASGQKLNFAEKHPTISGMATGIGAHAVAKHSNHAKP